MVAIYHWVIDGDAPFDALTHLLDYLWEDELRNYEASAEYEHTFVQLAKVANWLNSGAGWSPQQYIQASKAGIGAGWRVSATHETPGPRPPPAAGTYPKIKIDSLNGKTVDVSEAAKAMGFGCSVAVSVSVWRHLIAGGGAFHLGNDEESLAELLRLVAEASPGEGKDVYTWFHGASYGPGAGEIELIPVKALHHRDPDGSLQLTVMLSWEDES